MQLKPYLQVKIIHKLKQQEWNIELIYLYLSNVDLSIQRVDERVKNGGHDIKIVDIKRRYNRSISHLINEYYQTVDKITCINNANNREIIFSKNKGKFIVYNQKIVDDILEYKR